MPHFLHHPLYMLTLFIVAMSLVLSGHILAPNLRIVHSIMCWFSDSVVFFLKPIHVVWLKLFLHDGECAFAFHHNQFPW